MTVHFIGAGPGAADLLTVRATRLMGESQVCVYAGTYLDEAVLSHCPDGVELVDSQQLDLDQITEVLVRAHAEGKDVARLCSGDPSIYSAVAEQARRLDRATHDRCRLGVHSRGLRHRPTGDARRHVQDPSSELTAPLLRSHTALNPSISWSQHEYPHLTHDHGGRCLGNRVPRHPAYSVGTAAGRCQQQHPGYVVIHLSDNN